MIHRFIFTLIACVALGCGSSSDTTGPAHTLSGTWSGAIAGTVGPQVLSMDLLNVGTSIIGSGTLTPAPTASGSLGLAIGGSFVTPNLTATLTSGTLQAITLIATYDGTVLTGTVLGSGYTGQSVTLRLQ